MTKLDGRFSIGCWIDPDSPHYPDAEEFFDTRDEMEAAAKHLARRGGKYKSVVLYEWNYEREDWVDLDELRPDDD